MTSLLKVVGPGALLVFAAVSFFMLGRRKVQPPPPERFRALLFADQALDDFLSNPATRSARHGAWATLKSARVLISNGKTDEARAELRKALEQSDVPAR